MTMRGEGREGGEVRRAERERGSRARRVGRVQLRGKEGRQGSVSLRRLTPARRRRRVRVRGVQKRARRETSLTHQPWGRLPSRSVVKGVEGRKEGRSGQATAGSLDLLDRLVGVRRKRGKRGRAEAILREALRLLRHRGVRRPREARVRALRRARPLVESRTTLRAGARRAVPTPVTPRRREGLGLRRVVEAAQGRKGARRGERLAQEVRSLLLGRGEALRRRRALHKAALANRSNLRR